MNFFLIQFLCVWQSQVSRARIFVWCEHHKMFLLCYHLYICSKLYYKDDTGLQLLNLLVWQHFGEDSITVFKMWSIKSIISWSPSSDSNLGCFTFKRWITQCHGIFRGETVVLLRFTLLRDLNIHIYKKHQFVKFLIFIKNISYVFYLFWLTVAWWGIWINLLPIVLPW